MNLNIRENYSINFNANKLKTLNGNEYNHSNKALIAGGATCTLATGLSTLIKKDSKISKSKIVLTAFGLTAPLIALGAIADHFTNKERQKTADLVAKVGAKNALVLDENLKVSENGKVYKPTCNGTLFSVAGIGGALIVSGISHLLYKKGIVKNEIFKQIGSLYKMFNDVAPDDTIGMLISVFPLTLLSTPLMLTDVLNNMESKKN